MSIGNQIQAVVISTFVDLIGHGSVFSRIVSEIERTNENWSEATGAEKRDIVLKDLAIIFDDLIEPIAKNVLNLLLELGVAYVKSKAGDNENV
jgi:hypothetical protein